MLPEKAPKIVIHRGKVKFNSELMGYVEFERAYKSGACYASFGTFTFTLNGERFEYDTSDYAYAADANKFIRNGFAEHGKDFLQILADEIKPAVAPKLNVEIEPAVAPKLNVEIEPVVAPKLNVEIEPVVKEQPNDVSVIELEREIRVLKKKRTLAIDAHRELIGDLDKKINDLNVSKLKYGLSDEILQMLILIHLNLCNNNTTMVESFLFTGSIEDKLKLDILIELGFIATLNHYDMVYIFKTDLGNKEIIKVSEQYYNPPFDEFTEEESMVIKLMVRRSTSSCGGFCKQANHSHTSAGNVSSMCDIGLWKAQTILDSLYNRGTIRPKNLVYKLYGEFILVDYRFTKLINEIFK